MSNFDYLKYDGRKPEPPYATGDSEDMSGPRQDWERRCYELGEAIAAAAAPDRRDGHSALRVRDGKLERYDPHPETNAAPQAQATPGAMTRGSQESPNRVQGEPAVAAPDKRDRLEIIVDLVAARKRIYDLERDLALALDHIKKDGEEIERLHAKLAEASEWRKCDRHPDVNPETMWGCPDCLAELRHQLAQSTNAS